MIIHRTLGVYTDSARLEEYDISPNWGNEKHE